MMRHIVAFALTAGLVLAVGASPSPRAGRARDVGAVSQNQVIALVQSARTAVARRRQALRAGSISSTELDPVTLEALRQLALRTAAMAHEPHPFDGRVYVTTRRVAARAVQTGIDDDRPVFWVLLRGRFLADWGPIDGPIAPGSDAPRSSLLDFVVVAETLFGTDWGVSNHDLDTSQAGPATSLRLD